MAKYIARRAALLGWADIPGGNDVIRDLSPTCVAIKSIDGSQVFEPVNVHPELADAIFRLDERSVTTMSSEITASIIATIPAQQKSVTVEHTGARIPVMTSFKDVTSALVYSSRACIVRNEGLMLVWSDDPATLINVCSDVEKQLLGMVNSSV
jgi:hypothetical protein